MERLDPASSFLPAVGQEFGADQIIMVKDAKGGQPIRRWCKNWTPPEEGDFGKNGELYDRLLKKIRTRTKGENIKAVVFVWMQGEKDANEGFGSGYAENLKSLHKQLATDLRRSDIFWVVGRLSDFDLPGAKYSDWNKVREAQVRFVEETPRSAWVDTDDLNGSENELHYTPEGYVLFGRRLAESAIKLIRSQSRPEEDPENPSPGRETGSSVP